MSKSHNKPIARECCKEMGRQLAWHCEMHEDPWDCPDATIFKSKRGIYGLIVHDGGHSFQKIDFCPWCGTRLAKSWAKQRDEALTDSPEFGVRTKKIFRDRTLPGASLMIKERGRYRRQSASP